MAASRKTGELIIAYACFDCGYCHIGHADRSQQLAREIHVDRPCEKCGGIIPDFKKRKAKGLGGVALYCSDACQRAAANARRKMRNAQERVALLVAAQCNPGAK